MDIRTIRKLLNSFDGYHSLVYPMLKDKLSMYSHIERWNSPIPYARRHLFFEHFYLLIAKHIKENNLKRKYKQIIDIGCEFGFQQIIFDDFKYIGIDNTTRLMFFEDGNDKVSFLRESFPDISISLKDSIVISSMSLGYFNEHHDVTDEILYDKLQEAEVLYIKTTDSLRQLLLPSFDVSERIEGMTITGKTYDLWYMKSDVNKKVLLAE